MPGTQVRKSACKQSAQHSCGLGSMQIPLEHMKTVQEFPDLLFCVLVMQNMQKREVWVRGRRRDRGGEEEEKIWEFGQVQSNMSNLVSVCVHLYYLSL